MKKSNNDVSQSDKDVFIVYDALIKYANRALSATDRYKMVAELFGLKHWRSIYRIIARASKKKYSPKLYEIKEASNKYGAIHELLERHIEREQKKT